MTLETLARTIASARYGTDEFWLQMMPAAKAVRQKLVDEANSKEDTYLRMAVRVLVDEV